MFNTYIASALIALGLYGYAQYRGWSIMPSEAQEFQRLRAEQAYYQRTGGSGSRTGSSSGHK